MMARKTLLICLGTLLWLGVRAAADEFNIQHGPYLQNMGENEVTVMWVTNRPALSWVEVAPMDDQHFYATERPRYYQTSMGRRVLRKLHAVRITGLEKGTSYRYRVYSKEIDVIENKCYQAQYGLTASSSPNEDKILNFTTLNASRPTTSFTVVNDIHNDTARLKALTADVNKDNLVLFNGDMANAFRDEAYVFTGFMDCASAAFAAHTPVFFVRGNHETRGPLAPEMLSYFPTSSGNPYFTFRDGPVFFIMLDGGEDKPDSDIEYSGQADFDRFREQEALWLKEALASEACRTAPYRVVVIHMPPSRSAWHGSVEIQRLFVPLLNEANIDLMLCGHLHKYSYLPSGSEGCNFPILINSNLEAAHIRADLQEMTLTTRNTAGETLHTWRYPRRSK